MALEEYECINKNIRQTDRDRKRQKGVILAVTLRITMYVYKNVKFTFELI